MVKEASEEVGGSWSQRIRPQEEGPRDGRCLGAQPSGPGDPQGVSSGVEGVFITPALHVLSNQTGGHVFWELPHQALGPGQSGAPRGKAKQCPHPPVPHLLPQQQQPGLGPLPVCATQAPSAVCRSVEEGGWCCFSGAPSQGNSRLAWAPPFSLDGSWEHR